ncbi:hypothetical protein B0A49_02447 [Cryomyces minteri]|uniref:RNA polymerase II subunit B1 CTD phosphatase RPAP2 homolog n=1 Tax=Cryomyces minteri TaxID=331657 RepID=A0A4U0XR62_9PEZI|nr:hypothetical protein B0A49_02447 [Cryomyces minteri]
MAPISILKKRVSPPLAEPTPTTPTLSPRDQRNLDLALHHASLIQEQKDIEAQILSAIEELIDFPVSSPASASDIAAFQTLLQPFQPSDFDSIVEERQAADKCGYALCSNPPRKSDTGAKFRVVRQRGTGRRADYAVVERRKLEQWCSDECARRAMYIKVQLSEEPAWTRRAGGGPEVSLYEQGQRQETEPLFKKQERRDTVGDSVDANAMGTPDLALERGETKSSARSAVCMNATIREKRVTLPAVAPYAAGDALGHTTIEGYEPRRKTLTGLSKPYVEGDDGEEEDTDWIL